MGPTTTQEKKHEWPRCPLKALVVKGIFRPTEVQRTDHEGARTQITRVLSTKGIYRTSTGLAWWPKLVISLSLGL